MKSMIRNFGLAVVIALIGLPAVSGHAASCDLLDSGMARPQFMRDRMPECGGTQPAAPAAATASGSLTTLFASDNGGAPSGGIYFDLDAVGQDNVTITSWDTNLDASFTGDVSIWYRPGTYSGFETSSAGWILVGTATGVTSAGNDVPTPLNVGPLVIPAGSTYGIAISLTSTSGGGHLYTNGTGANQVYNDGVLELRAGSATNTAFSSADGFFTPRVWNGTVHYDATAVVKRVPTLGEFGLAVLLLLISGIALGVLRRRRVFSAS